MSSLRKAHEIAAHKNLSKGNAMAISSKFSIALLCGASALALSSPGWAQASDNKVEEVTVTGSMIISDAANSPTPLTVISADQIDATTPSDLSDGLNKLPQFFGSNSGRVSTTAV